jgi:type IV pilus assembly protein PilC
VAIAPTKKVTIYNWDGTNRAGKKVKGEMEGPSPAYISATLRRQGITPGKVRKKPKALFERAKKITPKDVAIFTRQLATMIAAGIPIAQGVDIISKGHDNPSMRTQLTSVRQDLEAGTSLSNALKKFPLQ